MDSAYPVVYEVLAWMVLILSPIDLTWMVLILSPIELTWMVLILLSHRLNMDGVYIWTWHFLYTLLD